MGSGVLSARRVGARRGPGAAGEGGDFDTSKGTIVVSGCIELGEPVGPAIGDGVDSGARAGRKRGNEEAVVLDGIAVLAQAVQHLRGEGINKQMEVGLGGLAVGLDDGRG